MLRISTTTIDRFHKYLTDDEFEEDKLLREIKGETEPSKYMELGTAFHDVLENCMLRKYDDKFIVAENGIAFPIDLFKTCYEYVNHNFPFEFKQFKDYEVLTDSGLETVKVVAKYDQLQGLWVNEFKTCWTGYDYDKYASSYQWRFYLDISEAEQVNYKIFELYDGANDIVLKGIHTSSFSGYEGMTGDINTILRDFVNYIHLRNLEEYFKEKENATNKN